MIKWLKPNGTEIETNDTKATIQRAVELGWMKADTKEAPVNDNSTSDRKRSSRKTGRKNS